ncbi:MAG TPA: sulfurtransferase [Casimicrobiaceae bacterium]|nr:sulfurtransferase [Casimicrobiaceae bacterium]
MPRAARSSARTSARHAAPAGASGEPPRYTTLIGTPELARHGGDPAFVVVDVRHDLAQTAYGENAYAQAHVPGALFAHVDTDLSAPATGRNGRHPLPTPEVAAAVFGRLGIDATKHVVAYDQGSGVYAARLWWMLRWLGHDNVAVLDGGFAKWSREGRPVESEAHAAKPARFLPARVRPTVNAAGVAASLPRHDLVLLDARAAERYRGDVEPLDPVAGHIPGALNRPHSRNVSADGTFRSAGELLAEFEAMLHGRSPGDVVHYCGSGVSACHNILAMTIAGYPLTRLYPGSWSEWCADPKRPVAKGQV